VAVTIAGSRDKEGLVAYIGDHVARSLRAGNIVVMDNRATRKEQGVKE
jgi:hypothetical protein